MNVKIDYKRLLHSIKETIKEEDWGKYDFNIILKTASLVYDNTAVMVKGSNFSMIFDVVSYELLNYEGFDVYG